MTFEHHIRCSLAAGFADPRNIAQLGVRKNRDYNFVVIDCGVLGEKSLTETFVNADVRALCGSGHAV